MTRVLIVEDDPQTADEIKAALGDHGFDVDHAATGLDGLGVLATLRTAGVEAPVLILSALSAVDERVRGLRAGGDDYLSKPFDFVELTARLDALLRRRDGPAAVTGFQLGRLEMDLLTHTVRLAGQPVDLQPREFRLLEYFFRNAGQVL